MSFDVFLEYSKTQSSHPVSTYLITSLHPPLRSFDKGFTMSHPKGPQAVSMAQTWP